MGRFNDKLEALLRDMEKRRAPDCSWLFPSPQRGPRDEHARTFRESLLLARRAADLGWIGFHDLRHFLASFCVMAGIDFMTIAAWLGHKDGGILRVRFTGTCSTTTENKRREKCALTFGRLRPLSASLPVQFIVHSPAKVIEPSRRDTQFIKCRLRRTFECKLEMLNNLRFSSQSDGVKLCVGSSEPRKPDTLPADESK